MKIKKTCSVDGCEALSFCKGYCTKHYQRFKRNGTENSLVATHGMYKSPEYSVWCGMKKRCYYHKSPSYSIYGAKGITVCDKWLHDFQAFYDDMGPRPTKDHQIDRIDPKEGYSPENCRWLHKIDNYRRRTTSVINEEIAKQIIKMHEKGMLCSEIGRKLNIPKQIAYDVYSGRRWA